MAPKKFHVTDAELSVLQVLWERSSATTREVTDELYPGGGTTQYYTVQKLLERMEARGCVKRDRGERVHKFSPAVNRETLIAERLKDITDSICGGALAPMLSGLLKLRRWTIAEQKHLRDLLAELESRSDQRRKS